MVATTDRIVVIDAARPEDYVVGMGVDVDGRRILNLDVLFADDIEREVWGEPTDENARTMMKQKSFSNKSLSISRGGGDYRFHVIGWGPDSAFVTTSGNPPMSGPHLDGVPLPVVLSNTPEPTEFTFLVEDGDIVIADGVVFIAHVVGGGIDRYLHFERA